MWWFRTMYRGREVYQYVGITPRMAASDSPGKLERVGGKNRPGDGTASPAAYPSHADPNRHISSSVDRFLTFLSDGISDREEGDFVGRRKEVLMTDTWLVVWVLAVIFLATFSGKA